MKIGCCCVTEDRAPIFGIALSSFLTQDHKDKVLMVVLKSEDVPKAVHAYETEVLRLADSDAQILFLPGQGQKDMTVPERIDLGAEYLFNMGCDLVTIWDDDDWSPVDRLATTADCYKTIVDLSGAGKRLVLGYNQGWFVNLRTLQGEVIRLSGNQENPLWGSSLTFNRMTWEKLKFGDREMPGYDRSFVQDCIRKGAYAVLGCERRDKEWIRPVAFSHGRNVATWLKSCGEPMLDRLKRWMPQMCLDEVLRCQQLMIDTRTYPSQP
jgi:hypothetical protein